MIFFVLPFFVVIYYAHIDNLINQEMVGMENFKKVLSNDAFKLAAKNTEKPRFVETLPPSTSISFTTSSITGRRRFFLPFRFTS